MSRLNRTVLTLSIVAGLVAVGSIGYSNLTQSSDTPDGNTLITNIPSNLQGFYDQKPSWSKCTGTNTEARCGFIQVPLNWKKPSEGGIQIAVAINPAKNRDSAPYLLMNPGGPGGSGREWITEYISSLGTAKLRSAYNIVGFDPRGVGASTAVKCFNTKDMVSFLYDPSPYSYGSAKDLAFSKKSLKDFGDACKENTGPVLAHVDTQSAAKDMDIIRAVLGSKKLNYLGYSYGTLLGITYAAYFPKNVGQFVLDGVVDPTSSPEDDSINQLIGFESAMKAYLVNCIKSVKDCPFKGLTVTAAMNKVGKDFLKVLEDKPFYNSDGTRTLSLGSGFTGMIAALYSKDSWQYLTQAFNEFFDKKKPDGRVFILLADSYFSYNKDEGTFSSNDNEAFRAISCLDSRESSNSKAMETQNKRALKISPVFGRYWQYGGTACESWPFPVVQAAKDYSAKTAPTILVVGTTNDPATPYSQAKNVAHNVLAHGWLLTYKGEGHTAYGSSNPCVANVVDDFLINNKLPKKERTC